MDTQIKFNCQQQTKWTSLLNHKLIPSALIPLRASYIRYDWCIPDSINVTTNRNVNQPSPSNEIIEEEPEQEFVRQNEKSGSKQEMDEDSSASNEKYIKNKTNPITSNSNQMQSSISTSSRNTNTKESTNCKDKQRCKDDNGELTFPMRPMMLTRQPLKCVLCQTVESQTFDDQFETCKGAFCFKSFCLACKHAKGIKWANDCQGDFYCNDCWDIKR